MIQAGVGDKIRKSTRHEIQLAAIYVILRERRDKTFEISP